MGHLTLRMISIVAASLMIFSLAQAENRAEKQRESQETSDEDSSPETDEKTERKKELTPEERFQMEQSLHRAERDQKNVRPPSPQIKLPKK